MEPVYDVVWPRSGLGIDTAKLAPRLATLNGARIGFVWDYLFRGDELFPVLAQQLTERFNDVTIVDYDVFGNSHGGDEAEFIARLPVQLASERVDAVISGMGC